MCLSEFPKHKEGFIYFFQDSAFVLNIRSIFATNRSYVHCMKLYALFLATINVFQKEILFINSKFLH